MNAIIEKPANQIAEVRMQLGQMEDQFRAALPAHIPVERFVRVVMTAVQNNPDLIAKASRRSLFNAAMRAAQDGLLPDGREGAIVLYGKDAQWMPMVAGLRKKVRNSGEIATWEVHVVHENDDFDFQLGDEPRIHHKPTLDEPGKVVAAYSIATLKSGEKSREVMSVAAIEKVRAVSRAKSNGPWVSWYEEMCRKTVARRHAKVLPMSTDLDDLVRRDDALYDFEGAKEAAQAQERPRSLGARLDALAAPVAAEIEEDEVKPQAARQAKSAEEVAQPEPEPQRLPFAGWQRLILQVLEDAEDAAMLREWWDGDAIQESYIAYLHEVGTPATALRDKVMLRIAELEGAAPGGRGKR